MVGKKQGVFDQSLQVMFGGAKAARIPIPENHILIVPTEDNWNDFGYRTKVTVYVNMGEVHWEGIAFIGFLTNESEEKSDVERIIQWLHAANEITIAAMESTPFFTMLPSMKGYREIVHLYGADRAVHILRSIRDLVALTEFSSKANWLNSAIQSQVFVKSFMRMSESFFAFYNAGSILRGLDREESGKLSKALGIKFRLPGRESSHDLRFHFDHHSALPKRIAVIIGKNGVGKSQTLGRIANAALTGDLSLIDLNTKNRPLINRLLAFAPTNESNSVFPTDRRRRPRIWYRRFSLNRSTRLALGDSVTNSIVQVARSDEYVQNMSRWDIFLKAIEAIYRWKEIHLLRVGGGYLPLHALCSSGERNLLENFGFVDQRKDPVRVLEGKGYPLSSGEISFLRFAAQASLYIENGSLLLLDEPETHLHPNFISRLVLLLDNLLQFTGSAAIIATHSVYFVREVFPAQVTVLRVDDVGEVLAEQPRLQTFGADVGAISYFVFGEDEPSRLAARVEQRLLSRHSNWEELYDQYKDELSIEVLGALREALELKNRNE